MRRNLLRSLAVAMLVMLPACAAAQYKFGYISYNGILKQMPEYAEAQKSLGELKGKYTAETKHNEETFEKMYADYLQGQKDFPQTIMLKRQKELQDEMERSVAFRQDVKRLLAQAEKEMLAPVRALLDSAIAGVGQTKGYEYILNTDSGAYPFIHSGSGEDATRYVLERLKALRHE